MGPLLFLVFVNDLPNLLQGKVLLFADDVKIISPLSQYNNTELSLRSAWDWSVTWDLPLNPSKCCHLLTGQPPTTPLIFADGIPVAVFEMTKDLEVTIGTSFMPYLQCRKWFSHARAIFQTMRLCFAKLTPAIFRPLYSAMVWPQIDYAVQAVAPYLEKDLMQKACDAMREGPAWIAISCAAARATDSIPAKAHSSDNVNHGLQVIPRLHERASRRVFRCASCWPLAWASIQGPAASIPTRPMASSFHGSSGRAVEQTANLRRGSAIAKCVQGEARQLLGDHFSRCGRISCKFIYDWTWFRHASTIFYTSEFEL